MNKKGSAGDVQVAFYGGSFTALPLDRQKSLLETVAPFIRSGRIQGVRISTRPDCIRPEVLELLKEYHAGTVELGVQSMNDRVLELSGRGHTAADTKRAVEMLRDHTFSIGLQLMPGLPGDSEDTFGATVHETIALMPDFVRLYPALVIKDTPLLQMYRSGRYTPISLDQAVTVCKKALLSFKNSGIEVIRMGLQPTEELEKAGTIIAGPYHPAFGQLVASSMLLDFMRALLLRDKPGSAEVVFLVNPVDVANAVGQKRVNIETLKKEFSLGRIQVLAESGIAAGTAVLSSLKPS